MSGARTAVMVAVFLVAAWGGIALLEDLADDSDCHGGYSVCIPNDVSDVDCDSIPGPIDVAGPDPLNLDGDGDGVGCEPTGSESTASTDSGTSLPPWYGGDGTSLPPWYGGDNANQP